MQFRAATVLTIVLGLTSVSGGSSHPQTTAPSAIACDNYARNYANNASRRGQVLGGAAVGSLVGLGIGSIFAAGGAGAAIGATVGVIGGGAKRNATAQQMYNAAYQDCMAGRAR